MAANNPGSPPQPAQPATIPPAPSPLAAGYYPFCDPYTPGNNGFSDIRYAAEFPLAPLPVGAQVSSAILTTIISNFEGTRAVQLHGYAGDGTVQIVDFAANQLLGQFTAPLIGTQSFALDVTSFIQSLVGNSTFAGFNIREAPANAHNFLLFQSDAVVLTVQYNPAPIPLPGGLVMMAPAIVLLTVRKKFCSRLAAA